NGKIDRRALPRPGRDGADAPAARTPAQTPTERMLSEVWREILTLNEVNRDDDFFALGGHSLLATQVVSRVREVFQLELPVRTLFEAPTLEGFARATDAALAREGRRAPLPAIRALPDDEPARLSFAQERMWFIQSMAPDSLAYNLPVPMRLRGELDAAALGAALDELRRRHEVLRTTYRLVDGVPMQDVQPWRSQPLAVVDLRAQGAEAAAHAMQLVMAEACTPFDLATGPVFRSTLYRLAEREHLLMLTLHHIACDQWSFGLLGRDLAELYNQLHAGHAVTTPLPPIRYRDFAQWQREWLHGDELERQLSYWVKQLSGLSPLELPTDRPRPQAQTFNGHWITAALPAGLVERVKALERSEGGTLFMVMYAAFAALLQRLTGQHDIAIGVPIANRNQHAVEALIGTFVNTLVMRADMSGTPSFRELVHRVRSASLDAYAHQDVPFEQLVEHLGRRDASRSPLVQVLFNVQNVPIHGMAFDGLEWEPLPLDRGAAQFELSFVIDTEIEHSLVVEYNSDLFDRTTVVRLVAQYFELLEGALARPDTPLPALPLLPPAQLAQLREWNQATAMAVPADGVYPQLFEAQVDAGPDRIALSFQGATLAYRELNARANQLAWHLRSLGVRPGVMVGVCLERGLHLPIALLAIQKSGGTYLPLDPGFPPERLAFMLEDSGAAVLVTAGDAAASIELPAALQVVDVAAQSATLASLSTANPVASAG
ncbi:MAG TPA: condensation domain-containing protein, partial [Albitalea sp.]|nr:condensation domain-containing protein [Albitalea sp.]